jgi:hypothetical protein
MSVESEVFNALKGLVSNRVFPDVAPDLTPRPYITYQQVGGEAVNFLDHTLAPSKTNSRIQVNVWADTRAQAAALAKQVEDALRATVALQTTVIGEAIAIYEDDTKLRGTIQDFSFWT